MKKIFLAIIPALIYGILLSSCNNKNEAEEEFQIIEFECTYEVDNLANELLVFILRDYFELVTEIRDRKSTRLNSSH